MIGPIDIGVLGATGLVGQHLLARLSKHPWFRIAWVGASERSAGRCYRDVPWRIDAERPQAEAHRHREWIALLHPLRLQVHADQQGGPGKG